MTTITDTQREVFARVFSYLPHPCASVWIAGGAVVGYETTGDIDVFFGRDNSESAFKFLYKLSYYQETKSVYSKGFTLFGEGYIPGINKAIQVIVTKAETADKGLQFFDISTCRWAVLSKDLLLVKGKDATASDQPSIILKPSDKTLGRYIRYCNRFGHPIDVEQVKKCVENVKVIKLKKMEAKVKITAEAMSAFSEPKWTIPTAQPQVEYYYKGLVDALGPKPDPQAQAYWNAQMLPEHYKNPFALRVEKDLKAMQQEEYKKLEKNLLDYIKESK